MRRNCDLSYKGLKYYVNDCRLSQWWQLVFKYATPIIRLLIRVISDLKINSNYLSDLDEMFYTKQLKDGKCNGDNYFQFSDATPIIRLLIRVISDFKVNFNYW